ncbi:hypothetical protein [Heterosigma akashiwo virus 01]|uniref:SMODS and SLOG-associating 2TM effector domain-containing protein n=1 Tax=Heterosigma akashiwo virus 01 TaxID=97195 RepID=A0A1C9C5B3_HAV01|nr:hypothetical protein D1R72_gp142 [Heterosigma akashiwo virus 01]AOM63473.1 hypothetical protein [Heterosigma akashiwo virus 01]
MDGINGTEEEKNEIINDDALKKRLVEVLESFERLTYAKHKKYTDCYNLYKSSDIITSIPAVIISAFTGALGFSSIFSCNPEASIAISSLNVFCAALLGISRFFRFNDMKGHARKTMVDYDKLFRHIYTELNMINGKNSESVKKIVKEIEKLYDDIANDSMPLPSYIQKRVYNIDEGETGFLKRRRDMKSERNVDV